MTTFFDTNTLIYLVDTASEHHSWASQQLISRRALGPTLICDIVYCEFSIGMKDKVEADEALERFKMERHRAEDEALFRAGRAFQKYKKTGGQKTNVLPDFIIGAIAELHGIPIVTKDVRRLKTYFPNVTLLST